MNRIPVPSANGTSPQKKTAPKKQTQPKKSYQFCWPTFGVVFTSILSALLNGYANAQHAPIPFLGWIMGFSVPVIVLTLSKVSGTTFLSGKKYVSYLSGGSGVALLFLSVYHCSESISLITGSGLGLAIPMALAIDCGLVSCEVAIIAGGKKK